MIKQTSKSTYNTMKVVKPYESVKNQKNTEQYTDFKWGQV